MVTMVTPRDEITRHPGNVVCAGCLHLTCEVGCDCSCCWGARVLPNLPDELVDNRTPSKGSMRFHEILREMGDLHDRKQKDYGRPNDPFANVRATEDWGQAAWVGAMIRATDKIKRLQKYATDGKLANEGARDSFLDLAVYAIIALVLWEEGHNE